MIRRVLPVLSLLLVVTAVTWASDFKSPVSQLDLKSGDTFVFLGNSITHQCLYTQYVENYFYTRYPGRRIRFHNSGIGGDRCREALIRFDMDVAAYQPKYVSVLLGMNDGRYQSYDQEIFDTYQAGMKDVIDQIKAVGAVPILITPTMYDSRQARINYSNDAEALQKRQNLLTYYNSTLAYYGAWVRDLAVESGYGFVDMFSPLVNISTDQRRADPEFSVIEDAVHPDPPGQAIMAAAFLRDMSCRGLVSEVRLRIDADGKAVSEGQQSEVDKVKLGRQGGSFQITAGALPWVLPEEARAGLELIDPDNKLNREILAVAGLEPGEYTLSIDGAEVGVYCSEKLTAGINLATNEKTPQYAQAAEVMKLNAVRNDTSGVKGLRNYVILLKRLRGYEERLKNNPADDEMKQMISDVTERLKDFDKKVADYNKQIRKMEDRIYKINRPKKHSYVLAPAS